MLQMKRADQLARSFHFHATLHVRPVLNPGYSRRVRLISCAYHVDIMFALYTCNTIHS